MIFDKYPYTNFHEMNDDWVIQTLREFAQTLDEFVAANSLTYADPIEYDPATIYPVNTVVIYNETAYVSKQAVPAGQLPADHSDYWLLIFPFGDMIRVLINTGIEDAAPALVNAWMLAHPTVTTTVNNNSITFQKLHTSLQDILLDGCVAVDEIALTLPNSFFEQGNLTYGTGEEIPATATCRTDFVTFGDYVVKFATLAGYIATIYEYDDNEEYLSKYYLASGASGPVISAFLAAADHKYRVTISNLNGDLAPADIPFGAFMYVRYEPSGVTTEEFDELVRDRYGVYVSRNMLTSEESLTAGYMAKNGTVASSSTLAYSDYIPVSEGDVLRTYYSQQGAFAVHGFRYVCCFDESHNVLSNKGSNTQTATFIVPEGVAYVRVTINNDSSKSEHVVSLNTEVSQYHAYEAPKRSISDDFLSPESEEIINDMKTGNLASTHLKNDFHCSIPRQALKMTKGLPESFYYWCSMFPPKTVYGYASTGAQYCIKHANKVEFPNNTTLSSANGYNWFMYDALFAQIDSYTGNGGLGGGRKIINENLANCTLLAIGDSTVDQDTMTSELLNHFTSKSKTLTLLGTLGSGANKNEGRAGWKISDYLTNKQYQSVVNPFYDPEAQTFNFSYYMTNQQYASVDFVVLQMGINDLSDGADPATIWANLKIIIDSILDYNSSIKVILNLPTTPNSDQSETNAFLFGYLKAVCSYDEYVMAHVLSEYNAANVRTSYCHLILDPDADISDNVHPTSAGYQKMALEIVNQINHWQNGD